MIRFSRTLPAAFALLLSSNAFAAGFFNLSDMGVRPGGRGGAFVAGADDLNSVWYNPAGLMEAGSSILLQGSYVNASSSFTRRTQVTGSSGQPVVDSFPTVNGIQDPGAAVIPSIVASYNFGLPSWNFALAIYVPPAGLLDYPETVADANGIARPPPQRYSLISPQGTVLGVVGLYVAKSFLDGDLQLGIGPELLLGQFSSTLTLTASPPGGVLSTENDPNYDSATKVTGGIIAAPSLTLGAIYKITPKWRLGLSGHLPYWINTAANVQVRLPSAAVFDQATVSGNQAQMKFTLPAIVRLGIETRPVEGVRVELAGVYEGWSVHDQIQLNRAGKGIYLNNVLGFPASYQIGDLSIPQNFRDTFSLRLGGEYLGGNESFGYGIRAGIMYERSAVPPNDLTLLALDLDRIVPSVGVGLRFSRFTIDLLYTHVFALSTTVNPATAAIPALNPVRGNAANAPAVNGGDYSLAANILGLALGFRF